MGRFAPSATLVALLALAVPVAAQPRADLSQRVESLEQELVELREAAAQVPTVSEAVAEIDARLAAVAQELEALRRQQASVPEAVEGVDQLTLRVRALEREVGALRTQLANIEQPSVATTAGGAVVHDEGFGWTTGDARFALRLGGYLQTRYQLELPEDLDDVDVSTFALRRARVGAAGHVYSDRLRFTLLAELSEAGPPLRDYHVDHEFSPALVLRFGQAKVHHLRSWIALSSDLAFLERSAAVDAFRYDRDIGAWLHGALFEDRLHYYGGLSNGGGQNRGNDNIDLVSNVRVDGAALGEYFEPSTGDVRGTETPSLVLGGSFVHDLVRLPAAVAGIEIGQRDVDANGVLDNVRVLSAAIDATFRYRGLEVAVEGFWRQDRWGTILEHGDNAALADAVRAGADGVRNHLGGTGQVTYFVIPEHLLVGGRLSRARIPLLGTGGQALARLPRGDRLWEADLLVQLYREGTRTVGLDYTYLNYDAATGAALEDDALHRLVLEAQLVW